MEHTERRARDYAEVRDEVAQIAERYRHKRELRALREEREQLGPLWERVNDLGESGA